MPFYPAGTLLATLRQTTYFISLTTILSIDPPTDTLAHEALASLAAWAARHSVASTGIQSPEYRWPASQYAAVKHHLEDLGEVFRKLSYASTLSNVPTPPSASRLPYPKLPDPSATTTKKTTSHPHPHLRPTYANRRTAPIPRSTRSRTPRPHKPPTPPPEKPSLASPPSPILIPDPDDWEVLGDTDTIRAARTLVFSTVDRLLLTVDSLAESLPDKKTAITALEEISDALDPLWKQKAAILAGLLDNGGHSLTIDALESARVSILTAASRGYRPVFKNTRKQDAIVYPSDVEAVHAGTGTDTEEIGYLVIEAQGRRGTPIVKEGKVDKERLLGGIPQDKWEIEQHRVYEKGERGWRRIDEVLNFTEPATENSEGICPLCNCIFSASELSGANWKSHILRDLLPFFTPDPLSYYYSLTDPIDPTNPPCPFCAGLPGDLPRHISSHIEKVGIITLMTTEELEVTIEHLQRQSEDDGWDGILLEC